MGAEQLRAWEVVLTSPVAVALLLLGAVLFLGGVLLVWIRGLIVENRQLHAWIRDHLESEAGVSRAIDDFRPLLELIGDPRDARHGEVVPVEVPEAPGAAPRVEGAAAAAGAAGGTPAAGNRRSAPVPRGGA